MQSAFLVFTTALSIFLLGLHRCVADAREASGHGSPVGSGDVGDRRLPGQDRRRVVRDHCLLKSVLVLFAPILSLLSTLTVRRMLGLQLLVLLRLLLQHPRLPVLLVLIGRCGLLPGPAELLKEAEARPRRRSLVLGSRCPRVLRFFRYCGDDTRKPDSVHQSSVRKLGAISFLEILPCVFAERLAVWSS